MNGSNGSCNSSCTSADIEVLKYSTLSIEALGSPKQLLEWPYCSPPSNALSTLAGPETKSTGLSEGLGFVLHPTVSHGLVFAASPMRALRPFVFASSFSLDWKKLISCFVTSYFM